MLTALAGLVFVLATLDHWTTWLCLQGAVPEWTVTEANPLADWLFRELGLVPALLLDTAVTAGVLVALLRTRLVPPAVKGACLGAVALSTGYAVVNNLLAAHAMGLLAAAR